MSSCEKIHREICFSKNYKLLGKENMSSSTLLFMLILPRKFGVRQTIEEITKTIWSHYPNNLPQSYIL